MNKLIRSLNRLNWIVKNHSNKIQNISAFVGSFGVVMALGLSINNYIHAKQLEAKNIKRDSIQLSLLDSIATQLGKQAQITEEQYEAQKKLNSSYISAFAFSGQDKMKYSSFPWKHNLKWRIPSIIYSLKNFGIKPAKNLSISVRTYATAANVIFETPMQNLNIPLNYNEIKNIITTPMVPIIDLDEFQQRMILNWEEVGSNTIQGDTVFYTCIKKSTNEYYVKYMINSDIEKLLKMSNTDTLLHPDKYYSIMKKSIYGY